MLSHPEFNKKNKNALSFSEYPRVLKDFLKFKNTLRFPMCVATLDSENKLRN